MFGVKKLRNRVNVIVILKYSYFDNLWVLIFKCVCLINLICYFYDGWMFLDFLFYCVL